MTRRYALKFLQISDPNPSNGQIKQAFKRLATIYHPDMNVDVDETVFSNLFQQLNESYMVLISGTFETDAEAQAEEKQFQKNRQTYIEEQRRQEKKSSSSSSRVNKRRRYSHSRKKDHKTVNNSSSISWRSFFGGLNRRSAKKQSRDQQ